MVAEFLPDGSKEEDLLLTGAIVLDGGGPPGRPAHVRISRGRIAARARELPRDGATVVDLTGHFLSPGFVDVHSHSDLTVLANPGLESKLTQGVTTEVVGNCGSSPFPVAAEHLQELRSYVDSFFPDVSRRFDWNWSDLSGWAARVRAAVPATNLVPLVGHGALRIAACGFRNGRVSPEEGQRMLRDLEAGLVQGAYGFSSGLAYSPELESSARDLAPLLDRVAYWGGIYATHQRDEGRGVLASVRESLESARASGVRLEISHLKCLGRSQWGGAPALLAEIAAARASGTRVRADFYPYRAGETTLTAFLPGWVFEGAWSEAHERLSAPADRERIRREVSVGVKGWTIASDHLTWGDVVVSGLATSRLERYLGHTIADLALAEGRDPLDLVLDLLLSERGAVSVLVFGAGSADVEAIGSDAGVLVGSDGIGNSLDHGPLRGPIHPRNYGTFPRFLAEQGGSRLAGAVHRATALAADHFQIPLRGSIQPGFAADLVTWPFDSNDLGPDYGEPPRYSRWFDGVWVNGVPAVWSGRPTGLRGGQVLLRGDPAPV